MKLAVITVNYNRADDTLKLIEALNTRADDRSTSVFVIDNGSDNSDRALLKSTLDSRWPGVHTIYSDRNLGFAGGVNLGTQKALEQKPDWVILLNNDTEIQENFFDQLRATLSGKGGIVGLPIREDTDRIARYGQVQWLRPTLPHSYSDEPKPSEETLPLADNCYIIGAAMCIHRAVLEKIGFLDEHFFLYFEDAELSRRAAQAGFALAAATSPIVGHRVSSTTSRLGSSLLLRYHYRNALYFNARQGPLWVKLFLHIWAIYIAKKQLLKIILGWQRETSSAILAGILDYYRGRMGQINV